MIKSLGREGVKSLSGEGGSSSPRSVEQMDEFGDDLVLAEQKRLELGTQLGEANLERPGRTLGLGRIEQLLFGPFAPETAQITGQRRHLPKGDIRRFGEQPPRVIAARIEHDEFALDPERVLMAKCGRKPVALDELQGLRTISHCDSAVLQSSSNLVIVPGVAGYELST